MIKLIINNYMDRMHTINALVNSGYTVKYICQKVAGKFSEHDHVILITDQPKLKEYIEEIG